MSILKLDSIEDIVYEDLVKWDIVDKILKPVMELLTTTLHQLITAKTA
jgi:hypothetical protein